jgi:hypothetical protein
MIVREIVERPTQTSPAAPKLPSQPFNGFFAPKAKASKPQSAFARKVRGEASAVTEDEHRPLRYTTAGPSSRSLGEAEDVRRSVDRENAERVAAMSPGERAQEIGELTTRFGSSVLDMMRKRRQARVEISLSNNDVSGVQVDSTMQGHAVSGRSVLLIVLY